LLGIAVGRVGMSRQDFEHCTPSEFSKIVQEYRSREETAYRAGWEQTRIQVISVANLFSKHPLSPEKAFPLPWDRGTEKKREVPKGTSSLERMREVEAGLKKKTE
jgi:hypothetical protein